MPQLGSGMYTKTGKDLEHIELGYLTEAIEQVLAAEGDAALEALDEAVETAAKEALQSIRETAPRKTGQYAKGWKKETKKSRMGKAAVIYNSKRPGLPHLLEFGHPVRRGGRTVGQAAAHPHILPVQEAAGETLLRVFREKMGGG